MKNIFRIIAIILGLLILIVFVVDILFGEVKSVMFYISAIFIAVIFIGYALNVFVNRSK